MLYNKDGTTKWESFTYTSMISLNLKWLFVFVLRPLSCSSCLCFYKNYYIHEKYHKYIITVTVININETSWNDGRRFKRYISKLDIFNWISVMLCLLVVFAITVIIFYIFTVTPPMPWVEWSNKAPTTKNTPGVLIERVDYDFKLRDYLIIYNIL